MKFLFVGLLLAGSLTFTTLPAAAQDAAALQADRALAEALAQGNSSALAPMLDDDFTSTDATGQTHDRAQVLQNLLLAGYMGSVLDAQAHDYGDVVLVTATAGQAYVLRVWVKRSAGWRLLVHQDTIPAPSPAAAAGARDCENPCKTLPFEPKTAAEKGVVEAWQTQETAETEHDSAAWAKTVADEFLVITSGRNRTNNKADRMATFDQQKVSNAPAAPLPLISARMFDFPGVVVMTSLQQRGNGKPNRVTRLWVERDGRWQLAFSQQTVVQPALGH